jgi:hypothetical protein
MYSNKIHFIWTEFQVIGWYATKEYSNNSSKIYSSKYIQYFRLHEFKNKTQV